MEQGELTACCRNLSNEIRLGSTFRLEAQRDLKGKPVMHDSTVKRELVHAEGSKLYYASFIVWEGKSMALV